MNIMQMQIRLRQACRRVPLLKQEGGSALIEFTIAATCFLAMVFGSMELCSATYAYTVLADAANEGVHYAVLNSSDHDGAVNTVRSYATGTLHDISNISISVTYPDNTTTPPARVAVSISYPYIPYLGAFMTNPPTMHAFAEGRMVR